MAVFEINEVQSFIDDRLKRQIDKKVVPDLQRKDKDKVFIIDGNERSGKSTYGINSFGGYIASCLKTHYDLDNICMTPEEFRKRVMSAKKKEVIIFDEGHRGFGSISVLSEINKILTDLMMEMGQKNLCIIIIMPTFFMLNKYVAIFRTVGLFRVYERKGNRGFWVFYNRKNKLKLYLKGKKDLNYNCMPYPRFRGRYFNKWVINEEEYRKKKELAFEKRPRMIKSEKYIKQRDRLVLLLHNELGYGSKKLAILAEIYRIGIKREGFRAILGQFKPKEGVGEVYKSINITTQDKGESENKNKIRENLEKSRAKDTSASQDSPNKPTDTPQQDSNPVPQAMVGAVSKKKSSKVKILPIPQEKIGESNVEEYNLTDLAAEEEEEE